MNTFLYYLQPKKDRILQKHEFTRRARIEQQVESSSRPDSPQSESSVGPSSRGQGRGRGGGRGRGQGRGRGRGGNGANSSSPGGDTQGRTWRGKDVYKARHANHNRKRGHDKKLARGGAVFRPEE